MGKKIVWVLVAVIVLAAAAAFFFNRYYKTQTPDTSLPDSLTVTLGELNQSNEFGVATITEQSDKTVVNVNLEGEVPSGVVQLAHIHNGSCDNLGDIWQGLTSVIDGQSQSNLEISMLDIANNLPLAINVHKSAEEPQVFVACGNISF
ncbi:MAG: hypothetical protein COT81_04510 [Candidatus Buchananbacteria bacterium CG10_big_fil_rev_8_21_14_0_10_42_9]|uniref:CHRD domain-containing protein n=1 Tax=Candidatus Buchananbacteria bacterium CG10_big_fil_rev_8_21_14_0_10_42_9 TaxID=1974526 RepID=A0A2H0W2Q7_9BACT|nr:MAG: hypothetical protein COT81_04510 [Candidatus Buchananbacteria bacterium CG10_big_fil_rev_8_21_14_0_10_42_9]